VSTAFRPAVEQSGAPRRDVQLADVDFQLATRAPRAFTRSGWWFELKYDGYRILAERRGAEVRLRYRGGSDPSAQFPEAVEALRALPSDDFILDGELVVEDAGGKPSFSLLQARAQRARPPRGAPPATYWTFDLLAAEGHDLRGLSLARRRELLRLLTADGERVRCVEPVETEGEAFFEAVKQMGLEGVVAKRADAAHHAGRGGDWQKFVIHQIGDFAVVGHTRDLTSLALATWDGDGFAYAGRVGSGLARARPPGGARAGRPSPGDAALPELPRRPRPPLGRPDAGGRGPLQGVGPARARPVARSSAASATTAALSSASALAHRRAERLLRESGEAVVAEDGFTKGDLIRYYQAIAPWVLPYLRDRPLMLTRFPDGIHGESFFQKQPGPYLPS
jgi:bifunctional non-homologous end joining protein LigD